MRRNLFWLSDEQWKSGSNLTCRRMYGVSSERTIAASSAAIVHVLKSGCRWCDCPPEYGPATTIYNRFVRWARRGVWRVSVPGACWKRSIDRHADD